MPTLTDDEFQQVLQINNAIRDSLARNQLYSMSTQDIELYMRAYEYFVPGMVGTDFPVDMTNEQLLEVFKRQKGQRVWVNATVDDQRVWRSGTLSPDGGQTIRISGRDNILADFMANNISGFNVSFVQGPAQVFDFPGGLQVHCIIPITTPFFVVINNLRRDRAADRRQIDDLQQQLQQAASNNNNSNSNDALVDNLNKEIAQLKREVHSLQNNDDSIVDLNQQITKLNDELHKAYGDRKDLADNNKRLAFHLQAARDEVASLKKRSENDSQDEVEQLKRQITDLNSQLDQARRQEFRGAASNGAASNGADISNHPDFLRLQQQLEQALDDINHLRQLPNNSGFVFLPGEHGLNQDVASLVNSNSPQAQKLVTSSALKAATNPHLLTNDDDKKLIEAGTVPPSVLAYEPATWLHMFLYSPEPVPKIIAKISEHYSFNPQDLKDYKTGAEKHARDAFAKFIINETLARYLSDVAQAVDKLKRQRMNVEQIGKYFTRSAPNMIQIRKYLDIVAGCYEVKYKAREAFQAACNPHNDIVDNSLSDKMKHVSNAVAPKNNNNSTSGGTTYKNNKKGAAKNSNRQH
jgi:hypothetical protein